MTAKIKKDWKLPEPPRCAKCNSPLRHVAVLDNDGWGLEWEEWCHQCDTPTYAHGMSVGDLIDWPFTENYAEWDDFRALGFIVEVA